MLNRITSGWTWLETALNAMIDEINRQKPLSSATIAVEESPNGTLLKVTQMQQPGTGGGGGGDEPWRKTPDGQTAAWQKISVIIQDPIVGCRPSWIWYWGTAAQ